MGTKLFLATNILLTYKNNIRDIFLIKVLQDLSKSSILN